SKLLFTLSLHYLVHNNPVWFPVVTQTISMSFLWSPASSVQISPPLEKIFLGDLILLRCGVSTDIEVTWYVNDMEQAQRNHTLKIEAAAPEHSGRYQCQHGNGPKSDDYHINVLDHAPSAALIIRTGQPVVRNGGSVVLQLDNEDGVKGWKCWVNTGEQTKTGHPSLGTIPVILFSSVPASEVCFCFVLLSEKDVWLEMYPLPAVVGVSLTLKCLAWGTDRVTRFVFYKDNSIIQESQQTTYQINNVTESTGGRYKCEATYTYVQRTAGPPYQVVSDGQDVFVQGKRNQHTALLFCGTLYALHTCSSSKESGTYACRFVWTKGRSLLSNVHSCEFLQDTYQYQINDKCGKFNSYLPLKDLSHKHFHSRMFHLCFRSTQRHSNYSYNCDRVGGSSIRGCVCGCGCCLHIL
uniref:Ig-like domain-containing protein n=1 Tax=Gasterosteus aculeatus aculeatus TaxID=481459 RepID=A0AAQ4NNL7_GASAC